MNVSDFLHELVKVETSEGTIEGILQHIDYDLSKHSERPFPDRLILENGNRLIIVRRWKAIKKTWSF